MNKTAERIADEVYKAWDIASHIKDSGVESDIRSAIIEAFAQGCAAGGMDKDLFEEALAFCNKTPATNSK